MSEYWEVISEFLFRIGTIYGLKVVGGLVILIVGWIAAIWAAKAVTKACEKSKTIDKTLEMYGAKVTRLAVLAVTFVAVLDNFGVETTSMVAFLGAMGLAIGLALRGTLSNVASGVVLLVLRPFKVGEVIDVGGTVGKVVEIGLFATELRSPDGLFTVMPNSKIWDGKITNITRNGTRRIELVFGIGYNDDMERALEIIREVVAADERVLPDPEPFIKVAELADSSVNIYCRPWTKIDDFFDAKLDITKRIKERFDAEGISIPFPQQDVHFPSKPPTAA